MNKLTAGDCVAVLGRVWALEQGIKTAEDLAAPARPEWADLAKRVAESKKSLEEGKEIVKAAVAKHGRKR